MARPKLGESDSKRLQMVITEDELDAIEEWQHNNRLPSKSEAIRRLCEIARTLDGVIPNATEHASDSLTSHRLHYYFVASLSAKLKRGEAVTESDLDNLTGWSADLLDRAEDILLLLMRENNRIVSLMDHKNIKTALAIAITAEEEVSKVIEAHWTKKVPVESKFLDEVIREMTDEERASLNPLKAEHQRKLDALLMSRIAKKREAYEAYRPQPYSRQPEKDQ